MNPFDDASGHNSKIGHIDDAIDLKLKEKDRIIERLNQEINRVKEENKELQGQISLLDMSNISYNNNEVENKNGAIDENSKIYYERCEQLNKDNIRLKKEMEQMKETYLYIDITAKKFQIEKLEFEDKIKHLNILIMQKEREISKLLKGSNTVQESDPFSLGLPFLEKNDLIIKPPSSSDNLESLKKEISHWTNKSKAREEEIEILKKEVYRLNEIISGESNR